MSSPSRFTSGKDPVPKGEPLDRSGGCGKFRPQGDSIPGPSRSKRVAIPAKLSRDKHNVHPRTGHEDPEGGRHIPLSLTSAIEWVVNATPRPLYPQGRNPVPIVQEAGWTLGPVGTGAKNLAPTGVRSPDHPGRSQSLHRLSYRGPRKHEKSPVYIYIFFFGKQVLCFKYPQA